VRRWLAPRSIVAYAVDHDARLLERLAPGPRVPVHRVMGDALEPLVEQGGPADGTVDLVVAHALADLVPLDRLAARVAALLRPGGLAHVALTYDGQTSFEPDTEPDLDTAVLKAFHRHMDRPGRNEPHYGGSTAGRRIGPALAAAGLKICLDAPSVWDVRADDGDDGRTVLSGLLDFVLEATRFSRHCDPVQVARWTMRQRCALLTGMLSARVGHRDVLARAPGNLQRTHAAPVGRPRRSVHNL
jgi:hypothetical protein